MLYKTKPYQHQLDALEASKDKEFFAYLMDMGTGKTKIIIDKAAELFTENKITSLLIIAPNNVHSRWITDQFVQHCPIPYKAFIWQSKKLNSNRYTKQFDIFINGKFDILKVFSVNVEAFQSNTVKPYVANFIQKNNCFIVVDEATRIKNPNAKRSKAVHQLNKYGIRAILTGTPTAKSPFDLWSMFEFLKPNYFDCNYFIFQHKYGVMMQGFNGASNRKYNTLIDEKTYKYVRSKLAEKQTLNEEAFESVAATCRVSVKNVKFISTQPNFTRFKRLDELKKIISADSFSVKKEDCLDLPPKVYEIIEVDMTKEQAKVYHSLQKELWAEYGDKQLTVANKVALTIRLMQVSGGFFPFAGTQIKKIADYEYTVPKACAALIGTTNAKIEALLEDMEEAGEQQIIVWCAFVAEIKAVYEALKQAGKTCCMYYGEISQEERIKNIDDFVSGKYDVFIGNTATAGIGLNLQCASLQYFFSNTFRTEDRLQAEDRSHRIGTKSTVVYKDIIAKGTIDKVVLAVFKEGKNLNDFFHSSSLKTLLDTDMED